jgi:hypothetical protein
MTLSALGIFSAAGAGGGVAGGGAYELIQSSILGSDQATIDFTSLGTYSSTYKHLQLRIVSRGSNSNPWTQYRLRFNGDGTTSYDRHFFFGSAGTVGATAHVNDSGFLDGQTQTGNSGTSGAFGASVVDILDAYSTTKNKTLRNFGGRRPGGDDPIIFGSGLWRNTGSITSMEITNTAGNFLTGSRFSLYGIKG